MGVVGTSLRELVATHDRPVDTESIKALIGDVDDRAAAYAQLSAAAAEVIAAP
jgi:hypothetical protein